MLKSLVSFVLLTSFVSFSAPALSAGSLVLPKDPKLRAKIVEGLVNDLHNASNSDGHITTVGTPSDNGVAPDVLDPATRDDSWVACEKWVTFSTIVKAKTATENTDEKFFDPN